MSNKTNLIFLFCLCFVPLMISEQSLWIDEGDTAVYAIQPDFRAWKAHLLWDPATNCQMPLSVLVRWGVAKVIGHDEWKLRLPNLLWTAISLLCLWQISRLTHCWFLSLWLVVQPYLWFYTHEARPYALQIAAGSLLLLGLVRYLKGEGEDAAWAWCMATGMALLSAATILAPVTFVSLGIVLILLAHRARRKLLFRERIILAGGLIASACFIPYYLTTVVRGVSGARLWGQSWEATVYLIYEMAGFVGLGPAPVTIRELARQGHLRPVLMALPLWQAFLLALTVALFLFLFCRIWRRLREEPQRDLILACAATFLGVFTLVVVAGSLGQKAIWARHLAPVFPFYVLASGLAISTAARRDQRLTVAAFVLCSLLFFSSLSLRFAPRHRNDDYRTAALLATKAIATGHSVWWAASWHCALYYGLPWNVARADSGTPLLKYLIDPAEHDLSSSNAPDLIVLSRPDIYDESGVIRHYAEARHYRPGPTIWRFQVFISPENPLGLSNPLVPLASAEEPPKMDQSAL